MIEHYKYYLLRENSRIYKNNKTTESNAVVSRTTINNLLKEPLSFGYSSLRDACLRAFVMLSALNSETPPLTYEEYLSSCRVKKIDQINKNVM